MVAAEPDHLNIASLRSRFKKEPRVFIEPYAVADVAAVQPMFVYGEGAAFNTLSSKFKTICEETGVNRFHEAITFTNTLQVETITSDKLIDKYGLPFFIKCDTEGYELNVLKGLHHPVPFLSFEFLLPEYLPELKEAILLLEQRFPDVLKYNVAIDECLVHENFMSAVDAWVWAKECGALAIELIVWNLQAAKHACARANR